MAELTLGNLLMISTSFRTFCSSSVIFLLSSPGVVFVSTCTLNKTVNVGRHTTLWAQNGRPERRDALPVISLFLSPNAVLLQRGPGRLWPWPDSFDSQWARSHHPEWKGRFRCMLPYAPAQVGGSGSAGEGAAGAGWTHRIMSRAEFKRKHVSEIRSLKLKLERGAIEETTPRRSRYFNLRGACSY
eukprot:SAG31_NODE_649_length_13201_cov_12.359258_3_plen_186_part_00